MTSSVVNCPLCSQPAFTSLASLSMCLVNVTTRALDCPVCHDTLPGLDKFTIHIFGHALNQQINNKTSSNGEISCDKNVLKVLSSTSSNNIIPIEIPLFIRNIDTQNYVMKDVNNKDFDSNNCMIAIASDDNNNNNEETTSSPKEVLKIVPLEVNTNNIFDTNDECSNIIPQECNLSKNNADLDDLDRNKDLLKNLEPYLKYSQVKTKIFKESNCTIVQNSSLSVPDSQAAQLSNKVNSLESSSAEIDNSIDDSSSETNTTKGLLSSNNLNFCQKNNDNYSDAIFKYYVGCDNASNSISCNDGKEVRSLLLEGKDFDSVRTTVNFDELVDDSDSSKTAKDISRRICKKSRDCSTTTQGVQTIEESFTKNNNPFSKFSPIDTNCSELDDHQESSDVDHPISENADSPQIANQNLFVDSSSSYWCDVCLFTFPDLAILKMHKNLVHGDHQGFGDTEKKTYACHLCSKSFNMRGSLMVHRRVAHPVVSGGTVSLKNIEKFKDLKSSASFDETTLQYCCKTCGKSFKKEQHLTQHERTHEVKQWECDICSKVFSTKYFLKKHKRLHTGEMPYTCTTCGKSFTFQQSYHKHLLYHSDEKPHVCCDCGRAFKELSTLHNHQRIHTGEKPFSCETCDLLVCGMLMQMIDIY